MFYRFISEHFSGYIAAGDKSIDYAKLGYKIITPEIKDDAIKTKGYFMYPSQLFAHFDTTSNRLGKTVKDKNARLAAVLKGVAGLDYGDFEDNKIDLFGDALDAHIDRIMQVFESKADVEHFAKMEPFEKVVLGEYNLLVSSYVEAKDNREVVEIAQLNAELEITAAKIDRLRSEIDAIVAQIEGEA